MKSWKARDARAKFSEVVREALKDGPQVITRNGKEEVVVVSVEQWRTLKECKPTLKKLLLGEGPRFDDIVPPRGRAKSRKPPDFD